MEQGLYLFAEEANQRLEQIIQEYNQLLHKHEQLETRFNALIKKYNDLNARYASVARALHRSLDVQAKLAAGRQEASHVHF